MRFNNPVRYLLVPGMLAVALAAHAMTAEPLTLTSATFKDGQFMPRKVANVNPQNPNCVGENLSPQFTWSSAPPGTRSFALLMVEPEGRGGTSTYHFVAYGIPASVTSFAEGELSKPSDKYVGGKSSHDLGIYSGPCTVPGPPHHYVFVLIATDLDPKELPIGLTRDEFLAKLAPPGGTSHSKGAIGMVGLFKNPQ
jgi:phosphatidylethanolamine-binding protein (PEBP) family uncharacterized protein